MESARALSAQDARLYELGARVYVCVYVYVCVCVCVSLSLSLSLYILLD